MSQYDQFILLAVLGGVAGLLVIVARQTRPGADKPAVVALVCVQEKPAPIGSTVEQMPVAPPEPILKRKREKVEPSIPSAPQETPIDAVLKMLRDKDSLAKAFLLREILDPPVSRRH